MSSTDFGKFSFIQSLIIFLIIFCDFGISVYTTKHVVELSSKNEDIHEFFIHALQVILTMSFITAIIFLIYSQVFQVSDFITGVFASLLLFLIPLTNLFDGFYRGQRKYKELSIIYFITFCVVVVPIYYFTKSFGIQGSMIALVIFYFVQVSILSYASKVDFKRVPTRSIKLKHVLQKTGYIGLSTLGMFLYVQVDTVVMGSFKFFAEVGYLEIANKLFSLTLLPIVILSEILIPYVAVYYSKKDNKSILKFLNISFMVTLIVGAMISLTMYFSSDLIYSRLFKEHYNQTSIMMLNLLLLIIPIRIFGQILTSSFIIPSDKSKILFMNNIFFGLLNLILDLFLIKVYGAIGIVYGSVLLGYISALSAYIIYVIMMKREEKSYSD